MSEFQRKVKERTDTLDKLVNSIDENTSNLRGDITECEIEMDRLERKNQGGPVIPGLKIREMMDLWSKENLEVADWDD